MYRFDLIKQTLECVHCPVIVITISPPTYIHTLEVFSSTTHLLEGHLEPASSPRTSLDTTGSSTTLGLVSG